MKMKNISPKDIESRMFYRLLSGIIGPRPIALVSSCSKSGNINLAPFSFFNVMSIVPPILVFSPLRRLRTNTTKDTLNNVQDVQEVVINIIGLDHVEQMSIAGSDYDSLVNEFNKSGFTQLNSHIVRPPRVEEALASFECKVLSTMALGKEGGAGNLVICEVLTAHFKEGIIGEDYQINVENLDLIGRLGQDFYAKVDKESLFKVQKISSKIGVGWDSLPIEIRENKFLTGNEISKLATVEIIPVDTKNISVTENPKVYKKVKITLSQNNLLKAWKLLYSANI
jgi:flavin reductase (DIM6/NTAB) family NADH-FMN oxidoreductase RutF